MGKEGYTDKKKERQQERKKERMKYQNKRQTKKALYIFNSSQAKMENL